VLATGIGTDEVMKTAGLVQGAEETRNQLISASKISNVVIF